eukprot:scaffold143054_cov54-Prasinocladus_malaysianus.AAC.1
MYGITDGLIAAASRHRMYSALAVVGNRNHTVTRLKRCQASQHMCPAPTAAFNSLRDSYNCDHLEKAAIFHSIVVTRWLFTMIAYSTSRCKP